jgi:putative flippase GtrA
MNKQHISESESTHSNGSFWYLRIPELLRFVVIGGLNTLVGALTIWAGMAILGMAPLLANATAYLALLPLSLWSFSRAVFDYDGALRDALMRFVGIFLFATLCNLAVVSVCIGHLGFAPMLGQLAGMTVYVAVYYPLNRMLFASLRRQYLFESDSRS